MAYSFIFPGKRILEESVDRGTSVLSPRSSVTLKLVFRLTQLLLMGTYIFPAFLYLMCCFGDALSIFRESFQGSHLELEELGARMSNFPGVQ